MKQPESPKIQLDLRSETKRGRTGEGKILQFIKSKSV